MIRLGLCCQFYSEPIRFKSTTARSLLALGREQRNAKLSTLCRANGEALLEALRFCATHRIGAFRIMTPILPLKTHGDVGYEVEELPDVSVIRRIYRRCGRLARDHAIRTSFHPDQFIVLSSPRQEVVRISIAELVYQAEVAEWVGADVITIHGGGGYGDKPSALRRLRRTIESLPASVSKRLALENDDVIYSPQDLIPVCREMGIPLVYDVHHHRCLGDDLSERQAAEAAMATWKREPVFHISSPREGWHGRNPRRHDDYVKTRDFPVSWHDYDVTVEVEAKAKELAVLRLRRALKNRLRRMGRDPAEVL